MPRPKGSKNKPKVDANGKPVKKVVAEKKATTKTVKPSPSLKKAVAKGKVKISPEIAKAVKESKPMPLTTVNAPELEPETPAATGSKTKAVAGKNTGEAVIRAVDDDEGEGQDNTVVMQGGKPTLRRSSSNPDVE